jgi:hypothetical protein
MKKPNFSLNFENPENFFTSQWQKEDKSLIYVIYRWIVAIFFTSSVIFCLVSKIKQGHGLHYLIYLTNWNLTLSMIMTYICAWLSTKFYFGSIDLTLMTTQLKLFWMFWTLMIMCSNMVSFLYWTFLYNSQKSAIDLTNILKHATNSIVLNIDWFIVKIPFKIELYAYSLIYGLSFLFFSWIYPFYGGLNEYNLKLNFYTSKFEIFCAF